MFTINKIREKLVCLSGLKGNRLTATYVVDEKEKYSRGVDTKRSTSERLSSPVIDLLTPICDGRDYFINAPLPRLQRQLNHQHNMACHCQKVPDPFIALATMA